MPEPDASRIRLANELQWVLDQRGPELEDDVYDIIKRAQQYIAMDNSNELVCPFCQTTFTL